jgi:hypothetical protein
LRDCNLESSHVLADDRHPGENIARQDSDGELVRVLNDHRMLGRKVCLPGERHRRRHGALDECRLHSPILASRRSAPPALKVPPALGSLVRSTQSAFERGRARLGNYPHES